jgi:hypothetical protein
LIVLGKRAFEQTVTTTPTIFLLFTDGKDHGLQVDIT